MITVKFKKTTMAIPTRWEELSEKFASAFVAMCPWFEHFETGQCSFADLKTGITLALLGVDISRLKEVSDTASENIFRISELLSFPFEESAPDESGTRVVAIHITLPRNLQPKVIYPGILTRKTVDCVHNFGITSGGVVQCDITAELYADTLELLDIYTSTRDTDTLDMLFSKYYGRLPRGLSRESKLALYYNLRGYFDWIRTLPDYNLLFNRSRVSEQEPRQPAPLGTSSGIYTLSKAGYGTLEEIKALPLFEYLGVMVQIVVDNIHELAALQVKPSEIAEKLGLSVEQVFPYLNNEK